MHCSSINLSICARDYVLEIIITSTALASFELDSLFSDYISTQIAKVETEATITVSLAVDALPSHFTDLTILQTE